MEREQFETYTIGVHKDDAHKLELVARTLGRSPEEEIQSAFLDGFDIHTEIVRAHFQNLEQNSQQPSAEGAIERIREELDSTPSPQTVVLSEIIPSITVVVVPPDNKKLSFKKIFIHTVLTPFLWAK